MDDEQTCGGTVEHGKESRLKTVEPARVGCASVFHQTLTDCFVWRASPPAARPSS
jgi:hypothetical protein